MRAGRFPQAAQGLGFIKRGGGGKEWQGKAELKNEISARSRIDGPDRVEQPAAQLARIGGARLTHRPQAAAVRGMAWPGLSP